MLTSFLLTVVAILVLLVMSGFFSGSETALTATSRARIHRLATDGERRAVVVNELIGSRERLIGAILLGNNLVNILASALATSVFLSIFGDAGVIYATFVMTMLVLIFAEVLPKTYAITNPDQVAMAVGRPIRVIVNLLSPIVLTVEWIVRRTLNLFGMSIDDSQPILSAHEEIRGAIELHHTEGSVVKHDRDMLGGILDLRDLTVDEVMVHRKSIAMFDIDAPQYEVVEQVLASPYTRIPFWQDDPENIVGILHAKDLLRAMTRDKDMSTLSIKDLLQEPWFIPETTSLLEQLAAFRRQRKHFALVVDEYGALMGLLTLEDILEEIVGEISDEHDIGATGVRPGPGGSVTVDGDVTIRDLNRIMDWNLPDDEAVTIAGLVIHEARAIPEQGQLFTYYGYQFEILHKQRNQITQLSITPPRRRGRKRSGTSSKPQKTAAS